jgi:hypothetical protein
MTYVLESDTDPELGSISLRLSAGSATVEHHLKRDFDVPPPDVSRHIVQAVNLDRVLSFASSGNKSHDRFDAELFRRAVHRHRAQLDALLDEAMAINFVEGITGVKTAELLDEIIMGLGPGPIMPLDRDPFGHDTFRRNLGRL